MAKNIVNTKNIITTALGLVLVLSAMGGFNQQAFGGGGGGDPAEIHGMKFNNLNNNGNKDLNEPGLDGWTINLECETPHSDSTITDPDGNYWFMDIPVAVGDTFGCTVSEVLQPGWSQTFPPGGVHIVNLFEGRIVEEIDFGNFKRPVAVRGEVLPVDTTALLVAGMFANAYWILLMIGGIIATAAAAIGIAKSRRRKNTI